ncbi:MAG: hypothetical protein CW345_02690 [Firmicutes bacterium]|nr:hypothetical protein [Bacillota bacterium]MBO2520704.1 hypothetical protein [Bacillota bacterium]
MRAKARLGRRTKELVARLQPGEIAVIDHEDLDEVAARSLVEAKPALVVNARRSISGRYPTPGPRIVLEAGIPVLDAVGDGVFQCLADGDVVEVKGGRIYRDGRLIAQGRRLTREGVEEAYAAARRNVAHEIEAFVENTLEYARREKDFILGAVCFPRLDTGFAGRPALVVVRGPGYLEDLRAIASWIDEVRPVTVGVDGGADALMELGVRPDVIVGDMDSVSDEALRCGAELVVHAYPDGRAPGMDRLRRMGLAAHQVASVGTSEDVALLMAYELGASLIVAVGTHSNIVDFFEKGRRGMASTFLVRLKVGSILVDAKGLSQVYRGRPKGSYPLLVLIAALLPFALVALLSAPVRQWVRLFVIYARLSLGF